MDRQSISETNRNGTPLLEALRRIYMPFSSQLPTPSPPPPLTPSQVLPLSLRWGPQLENHSVYAFLLRWWCETQRSTNRTQIKSVELWGWQFFGTLVSIWKFPPLPSHFLSARSVRLSLWGRFYCGNPKLGPNLSPQMLSNCCIVIAMEVLQCILRYGFFVVVVLVVCWFLCVFDDNFFCDWLIEWPKVWPFCSFFFNWSVVDLQCCCVNFCCIAEWFSYTYIYIHSFSDPFPI